MPVFLTLGSVTFKDFEIPERVPFGGGQSLAVHQMVGGQRQVDAMGRNDHDVSWSGRFRGGEAAFRAQFLDSMRIKGAQVSLTYSQFNYLVCIKDFHADFERFYEIPYTITVTIIQDLNNPFPILIPVAYDDAIDEMMAEAQDLANAIADPNVTNSMALLAYSMNQVDSLATATDAQIASVLNPLQDSLDVVGGSIDTISGSIF